MLSPRVSVVLACACFPELVATLAKRFPSLLKILTFMLVWEQLQNTLLKSRQGGRIPLDVFWHCFEKDFGGLCLSRYTYANEAAIAG